MTRSYTSQTLDKCSTVSPHQTQQIVVKIGGNILKSETALASMVKQLSHLANQGHQLIIVHGAGPQITEYLSTQNIQANFVNGLRVTDDATLMAVFAALGQINHTLVSALKDAGLTAVGLHAEPGLFACKKKTAGVLGAQVDLGWVGLIKSTNIGNLRKYDASVLVISPMGWDEQWNKYNINADHAALAIASALKADRLVFVSDVPGVLSNKEDATSVLSSLNKQDVEELIVSGKVSAGMLPKLTSSIASVDSGVEKVSIISGYEQTALVDLVEGKSVGTTFQASSSVESGTQARPRPLAQLALKEIA